MVSRVKILSCKAKNKICWKKRIGHSPVLQLRNVIISCLKNENNGTRVMHCSKTTRYYNPSKINRHTQWQIFIIATTKREKNSACDFYYLVSSSFSYLFLESANNIKVTVLKVNSTLCLNQRVVVNRMANCCLLYFRYLR